MKKLGEQKWMLIVYAVLFITIGLLEFILSIVKLGVAVQVMSYSIAVGLFLVGLMHIIVCLVAYTKAFFKAALILGSIAIALGVILCVNPYILAEYLLIFISVVALALGAVLLVKAILAICYRYKGGWIFLYFLFATLCLTFGILALVFRNKMEIEQAIYCASGAFILAIGVFLLVAGIKVLTTKKEIENAQ